MSAIINIDGKAYIINLECGIDISIPTRNGPENPRAFHAPNVAFTPVRSGDFIGDTQQGGVVNFKDVRINPHGNGTHIECVGHISREPYFINDCLKDHFVLAQLVTIHPTQLENGDTVILNNHVQWLDNRNNCKGLIIRTKPNDLNKLNQDYSGTNPAYMHPEAIAFLVYRNYEHLLVDFPSIDREHDEGKLLSHKAWWKYPGRTRINSTVTEMIYVHDEIPDGLYILQLNALNWELDASPCRPILYPIISSSQED